MDFKAIFSRNRWQNPPSVAAFLGFSLQLHTPEQGTHLSPPGAHLRGKLNTHSWDGWFLPGHWDNGRSAIKFNGARSQTRPWPSSCSLISSPFFFRMILKPNGFLILFFNTENNFYFHFSPHRILNSDLFGVGYGKNSLFLWGFYCLWGVKSFPVLSFEVSMARLEKSGIMGIIPAHGMVGTWSLNGGTWSLNPKQFHDTAIFFSLKTSNFLN